jgi:ABC-type multidrug transport system fused ATPase/permease subunit
LFEWGQRQRIDLARVFLRNCPILIFDEATPAFDSESQRAVYQVIKAISKDKMIIVIFHRFNMMLIVDEMFVFERGKIVEQDSYKNLLADNTLYCRLYER